MQITGPVVTSAIMSVIGRDRRSRARQSVAHEADLWASAVCFFLLVLVPSRLQMEVIALGATPAFQGKSSGDDQGGHVKRSSCDSSFFQCK